MVNSEILGGVVSNGVPLDAADDEEKHWPEEIRSACDGLLRMMVAENLTNAEYLELRRIDYERQRDRASAIHSLKEHYYDSIHEVYLREEPGLIAAIKRGERAVARDVLNRVLVGIYHAGSGRLDLLKSLTLELVVTMCRAAVEAGADAAEVFGPNWESIPELALIESEEELCHWLTRGLERVMDGIHEHSQFPNTVLLDRALTYMQAHLREDLTRETVAEEACLSVSHFSHLLKEKVGRTFSDLVRQYRVDRARELLVRTEHSLARIAQECGFYDQSHFSRVFRQYVDATPRQYRRQRRPDQ